ncbi:MAG: GNAT family N-acetyltransferase, partial [Gammaproteobacteria bacterium]|nr:GNAT family N-acetyltransferase [Gammaproteobacteria bacterium]MBU1442718.1 GNAT family N-acetyltransferase [Gammaproteobacteria bacterium]
MAPSEAQAISPVDPSGADAAGALALSTAAGWNQTADDWAVFGRHGRVVGYRGTDGELIATAASLPFDAPRGTGPAQGWISMVLVHPDWRHRGLATELLGDCVSSLQAAGIKPVLDATPAGEPVYRRLGFEPGMAFERWEGDAKDARAVDAEDHSASDAPCIAVDADHAESDGIADIAAIDRRASRIGRRFLLDNFLARPGTRAWMSADRRGFVLSRAGRRATQIGPLAADDERTALALLAAAISAQRGPVFIDVVRRTPSLAGWLTAHGFRAQRPFVRMALGPAPALQADN